MAELSAKKVMAFALRIMVVESAGRPYAHWNHDDVQLAIFKAIVAWDSMLRSDFTTGMDITTGQLAGGRREGP